MCGRYSRSRTDVFYVEPLMTDAGDSRSSDSPDLFRPSWNVSPGTKQPILKHGGPHLETWDSGRPGPWHERCQ